MSQQSEKSVEDRLSDLEMRLELIQEHKHDDDGRVTVSLWSAEDAVWSALNSEKEKAKRLDKVLTGLETLTSGKEKPDANIE